MDERPEPMAALPAWVGWVPDPYDESVAVVVQAATPGKAKAMVAAELAEADNDLTAVRVRRVPALDGQRVSDAAALSAGAYGWVECHRCYRVVHGYDLCEDACVGFRGAVYCSRACCIAGEGHGD